MIEVVIGIPKEEYQVTVDEIKEISPFIFVATSYEYQGLINGLDILVKNCLWEEKANWIGISDDGFYGSGFKGRYATIKLAIQDRLEKGFKVYGFISMRNVLKKLTDFRETYKENFTARPGWHVIGKDPLPDTPRLVKVTYEINKIKYVSELKYRWTGERWECCHEPSNKWFNINEKQIIFAWREIDKLYQGNDHTEDAILDDDIDLLSEE